MPALGEITALLEEWYPLRYADDWDAGNGLVCGDPADDVRRILLALDPVAVVAAEAVAGEADLLVVHHPLFYKGTHSVAATTPKGRVVHALTKAGCALYAAHTNADAPAGGVSEAFATRLGLIDLAPLAPAEADPLEPATGLAPDRGAGRVGTLAEPTTLKAFAAHVSGVLPATAHGVRVSGDPDRPVRRVAVLGGAGDGWLDDARAGGVDVYVTSDLRHHPASEFREYDGPALVDVAHWAAESTWLPVLAERLTAALAGRDDTVEIHVSTTVTDPWTFRVDA